MRNANFQDFSFIIKSIAVTLILLIGSLLLVWIFFPVIKFAFLFLIMSVLTLVLLSIPAILTLWYFQGWVASLFKSNDFLNDQHIGVIIIIYKKRYFWKWFYVYLSGIELLTKGLIKRQKKFAIYRCSSPIEFKNIVNQPQTIELWIFSHGKRDRISFGNNILEYQELQNAPKKNRVVQLHCNHGGGKSLADYLCYDIRSSFVTDNVRSWHENRIDILTLLENIG
ncbi:MAG: hypothetical protein ABFC78_06280 [Methanoregula sp.]